jgi:hypothetical protein
MKANIIITESNENNLSKVKVVALINDRGTNKETLLNLSIEIAAKCIEFLDNESFENVTGFKKTL